MILTIKRETILVQAGIYVKSGHCITERTSHISLTSFELTIYLLQKVMIYLLLEIEKEKYPKAVLE